MLKPFLFLAALLLSTYALDDIPRFPDTGVTVMGTHSGLGETLVADLDDDGDADVVVYTSTACMWFENNDGVGGSWTMQNILVGSFDDLLVVDLDGSGSLDIVYGNSTGVAWLANTGNATAMFPSSDLVTNEPSVNFLSAADFDVDMDMDLAVVVPNNVYVLENTENTTVWISHLITSRDVDGVHAADIDGDGLPDLVVSDFDVLLFHNSGSWGPWTESTVYDIVSFQGVRGIDSGDFDNDLDVDVVVALFSSQGVAICRNGGDGTTWTQTAVTEGSASCSGCFDNIEDLTLVDVDGDGDLDVSVGARRSLVWLENTAGDASAWDVIRVIDNDGFISLKLSVGFIDNDDYIDFVYTRNPTKNVEWRRQRAFSPTLSTLNATSDSANLTLVDNWGTVQSFPPGTVFHDLAVVTTIPPIVTIVPQAQDPGPEVLIPFVGFPASGTAVDVRVDNKRLADAPLLVAQAISPANSFVTVAPVVVGQVATFTLHLRDDVGDPLPGSYVISALTTLVLTNLDTGTPVGLVRSVSPSTVECTTSLPIELASYRVDAAHAEVEVSNSPFFVDRRIFASGSSIEAPTAVVVGDPVTFTVRMADATGSPIAALGPGSYDDATVALFESGAAFGFVRTDALNAGTISVTSNPIVFAEYALHVLIRGEHVVGSPFALDRRVSASNSFLDLPPSTPDAPLVRETETAYTTTITLRSAAGVEFAVRENFAHYPDFVVPRLEVAAQPVGSVVLLESEASGIALVPRVTVSYVSSETGTHTFTLVVAGAVAETRAMQFSALCPPGQFGDVVGCSDCPFGTYSETGTLPGVACTACAADQFTPSAGSTSFLNCSCVPGTWFGPGQREPEKPCEACPVGAVCKGEYAAPVAASGFFPTANGAFVECPMPRACLGNGQCGYGYKGQLCASCANGFYRLRNQCYACNKALNVAITVLLVLGGLCICAALLAFSLAEGLRYKFAAAVIGLNGLQIAGTYSKLELDWGPIANTYFDFASSLNLNLELTSPECSLSAEADVWVTKLLFTLLLPVFSWIGISIAGALFAVFVFTGVGWLGRKTFAELKFAVVRAWFQSLVLLYLPLTSAAFSIFGCRKDASGRWVLDADPVRTCFNKAWWSGLFLIGLVGVSIYAFAIPAAVALLLYSKRAQMDKIVFAARFDFLVGRFSAHNWWFEVAIMGRKLLVVMSMTFFFSNDSKANAAVFALLGSFTQLVYGRPYCSPFHNLLAIVVLMATMCVLHAGTYANYTLRRFAIITGIIINLVAIVGGNALDIWLLLRREKETEVSEFFVPGVFRGDSDVTPIVDNAEGDKGGFEGDVALNVLPTDSYDNASSMDASTFGVMASRDIATPLSSSPRAP